MLLLIRRAVILAHDMMLAIEIGNVIHCECLRVRLPLCIVMRLGFRSLLNCSLCLFDMLHEEIYSSMVH